MNIRIEELLCQVINFVPNIKEVVFYIKIASKNILINEKDEKQLFTHTYYWTIIYSLINRKP